MAECQRHLGKKVRIKLKEEIDSQRVIIGELKQAEKDELTVLSEQGTTNNIEWENVQKARLTL